MSSAFERYQTSGGGRIFSRQKTLFLRRLTRYSAPAAKTLRLQTGARVTVAALRVALQNETHIRVGN